jgi:hypothetical protein
MEIKMSDIFKEVKELGIKFDSHYSDLYIPVNDQTRELVKKYLSSPIDGKPNHCVSTFYSNLPEEKGQLWYDLAFQYLPYWEEKQGTQQEEVSRQLKKLGFN